MIEAITILTFLVGRVGIGILFLSSGIDKLVKPNDTGFVLGQRFRLNAHTARRLTSLLGAVELFLGVSAFLPWWALAASATALVVLGYAIVIAKWAMHGTGGSCGCGGIMREARIGWPHAALLLCLASLAGTLGVWGLYFSPGIPPGAQYALYLAFFAYIGTNIAVFAIVQRRRKPSFS